MSAENVMDMNKQCSDNVNTGKLHNNKISLEQTLDKSIQKLQLEQVMSYDSMYQTARSHFKFYCFSFIQELSK